MFLQMMILGWPLTFVFKMYYKLMVETYNAWSKYYIRFFIIKILTPGGYLPLPLGHMHAIILIIFKGSIFLKNRHFIIQGGFNKLIYGINTIIKCGTWQPVKFRLVSRVRNEIIFYCSSELMLPTLIQKYDKIISF